MHVHALRSAALSPQAPRAAAAQHASELPAAPAVRERLDRVELIARAGLLTVDRARELLEERHGPLDLALAAGRSARFALRLSEPRLG